MCGIFGVFRQNPESLSEEEINRARDSCDELFHRGPDQYGEWTHENIYLGHRRLSILDRSERGRQPLLSSDGRIAVAVNGEIYNFRKLRKDLGVDRFRSDSDSEVVLHGYETWGIEGLLQHLEGMFAFSLVDLRRGKIFLVRDRVGIKPLYYGCVAGYTFWASELKAVKKFFKNRQLRIDKTALYDFLTYRYVPAPKSLYEGCYKVQPAHFVEVKLANGHCSTRRYWQLPTETRSVSIEDAAEKIRHLVGQSVEQQMVSDVPVGFFLSGGIDSSIVVAEAATLREKLSTFSIGYDVEAYDETEYAEIIARQFSTEHVQKKQDAYASDRLFQKMERWYDEPFADTSALPTYEVSCLARQEATVVLTGDGGDELFGGYRWYKRFKRFRSIQRCLLLGANRGFRTSLARGKTGLARKVASRVDLLSCTDPLELYARLLNGRIAPEKASYRKLLGIDADYDDLWRFRRYYRDDLPIRKRMQYLDFHTYLPDDILTKVDRASMAVSLEARVPLLDSALTEFAFSLPEEILYHDGTLKGALKYAYRDKLPASILNRGKKGFSIPIHSWDKSTKEDARVVLDRIAMPYFPGNGRRGQ